MDVKFLKVVVLAIDVDGEFQQQELASSLLQIKHLSALIILHWRYVFEMLYQPIALTKSLVMFLANTVVTYLPFFHLHQMGSKCWFAVCRNRDKEKGHFKFFASLRHSA